MDEVQPRTRLRKYLLGELSESERSQLADRYFVDESLLDELLDVENELLDKYARGQLQPEETKNFRAYLTGLPDGHIKLATAYVLNDPLKRMRSTSPATLSDERQVRQLRSLSSNLDGKAFVSRYLVAVTSHNMPQSQSSSRYSAALPI